MNDESDTRAPVKRKSHRKSRLGCQQCKQRKIKCDENKPQCDKCIRSSSQCSFLSLQPHRFRTTPTSPLPPLSRIPSPQAAYVPLQLVVPPTLQYKPAISTPAAPSPASLHQYSLTSYPSPANPHSFTSSNHHSPGLVLREGPAQSPHSLTSSNHHSPGPVQQDGSALSEPRDLPLNLEDIELMWNFAKRTSHSMAPTAPGTEAESDVWTDIIPDLALKYEFLMHGVLALSALHLAYLRPEQKERWRNARDRHIERGLALYRVAINSVNKETCHACWLFSIVLALTEKPGKTLSLSSMQSGVGFVNLLRAGIALHVPFIEELNNGPVRGLFEGWKAREMESERCLPKDEEALNKISRYWSPLTSDYTRDQGRMFDENLKILKEVFALQASQSVIPPVSCALAWASTLAEEYTRLIAVSDTGALILLAHFCVLLNRVTDTWWIEGEAVPLLISIREVLGPENEKWIRYPLEEVGI